MFSNSDPHSADLDFELVDENTSQTQSNKFLSESMLKDLLSSSSSACRIIKPTTSKKATTTPIRRQINDDFSNKQRTPPNSAANSSSPISSSFLTRLPQENSTIRLTTVPNSIRMNSPSSNKISETMTLLFKPNINAVPIVQTRLENPTKYHLEQISRKQTLVNELPPPTTTILSPTVQQEESSPDSEITSEMDDQLNDETTSASVESHSRGISITPRLSTTLTNEHIGSVFLSSSLSKETGDSDQRHSSSCPTNILSAKAKIGLPLTEDELRLVMRDRQKKDNHNMIERRRRFNINDRIKELGTLLPRGSDLDSKQNKGTILRASVDYIKILQRQYENSSLIEEKCQILASENLALQERVKELERKCLTNGISIQPSATSNKTSSAIPMVNTNIIKQEPSSLSSSLNNNPLVPPSTPIFSAFESFSNVDSPSGFGLVDEDSNDTNSINNPSNNRDPLSPLTHDPFLSSTSFGFDNEMDIGADLD